MTVDDPDVELITQGGVDRAAHGIDPAVERAAWGRGRRLESPGSEEGGEDELAGDVLFSQAGVEEQRGLVGEHEIGGGEQREASEHAVG